MTETRAMIAAAADVAGCSRSMSVEAWRHSSRARDPGSSQRQRQDESRTGIRISCMSGMLTAAALEPAQLRQLSA